MVTWQPASASWTARVIAGPGVGEAGAATLTHLEKTDPTGLLLTGLRSGSLHGLPLRSHRFLSSQEFEWRSAVTSWRLLAVSSLKNEEAPTSTSDLFEIARKKIVKPFPSSREDSHARFLNTAPDRGSFAQKYLKQARELSYGPFNSGRKPAQSQEATIPTGAHDTRISLPALKRICSDAWGSGLRSLEATHLAPLLPFTGPLMTLLGFVLILGIVFGQWIGRSSMRGVQLSNAGDSQVKTSSEPKAPTGISVFLEGDMKKKESVEWVNMVFGKLWKVYRLGLESWLVGLLQPLIDNLQKPDYVKRVQIKRFDLGDEPISIRSVERRTSRRANDLQYHIGLRYTGGARMILLLNLKAGIFTVTIPVGVRGLDVDGELWVKLRLVPSEPWVGTATWAFVSLPKIKLDLSPFRLFNLMAIPFLSVFLTKLLTQDLPQLFVQPNKNVIDFLQGRAVGPVPKDFKGATVEGNTDFSGELSVTLVDARKLKYAPYGKTDPYVVFILGDQVIRSKKNSQTSVVGPPGGPIWNQDFQLLVVDPKTQRLDVRVRDYFGLTAFTVGAGEVDLISLRDTVPVDKVVRLRGVWGPFQKRYTGEVLLRLTYTAYVEDEDEDVRQDATLSPSSYYVSVADENSNALPLVMEVIDKVAESIQGENLTMTGTVATMVNAVVNNEAQSAPEPVEANDSNRATGAEGFETGTAGIQGATASKNGSSLTAQAEDAERSSGRTVLIWLGVVTGLSILVAISLNFSNLMNP